MDAGIRFLVASDVHLGHRERDAVRGRDSFRALEEVMAVAKAQRVDFLLLGGDLFDEVNPSKECFFECLSMLRANVFGTGGSGVRASLNGAALSSNLNDPDLQVALPIFTIHGNHDYPTNDFGKISACDLLQASGLVTYFGKHLDLRDLRIRPIIITKPNSTARIALYGLGYIKDTILNELFEEKKVRFEEPEGGREGCLCIFVLHQNRYKKGLRAGAPLHQSFNPRNIPEWMGLVIWGHEHEAIYRLEEECGRPVYQPGSTILTSFIDSEAQKKQTLLVTVAPDATYDLASILLERSFRPMRCLAYDYGQLRDQFGAGFELFAFLESEVERVLREVGQEVGGGVRPVIRAKVEATGLGELVRARQLEAKFVSRVANGEKILQFWRRKEEPRPKMEDEQLLSRMKDKAPLSLHSPVAEQLDSALRASLAALNTTVFSKHTLTDIAAYLAKTDNANARDIIQKKCTQMERHRLREQMAALDKLAQEKETEFRRAMRYHLDRKNYFETGKFDRTLYSNCNNDQDFLNYSQNLLTPNKFAVTCKLMQEKAEEALSAHPVAPPTSYTHSHEESSRQSTGNPSRTSQHSLRSIPVPIKREGRAKKEERSLEAVERSDSEDCCSRAERTQFDETGNKLRYLEAQEEVRKADIAKRKRPPPKNKPPPPARSEQHKTKNVHYKDEDFL